jgi:tetratricopeptide (TPR) repeat protein
MNNDINAKPVWHTVLRFSLVLLGLFVCYRLILGSARYGAARMFTTAAMVQASIEPADTAVRINPDDPAAHYARALSLVNAQRIDEAITELRQAIQMRPHHYYEWLDLGVTLDRMGDQDGAGRALRESIRLAPSFAQPHWQLGSLLYRQQKYEEAFDELRMGAKSNPSLEDGLLDLAWIAANGNVTTVDGFIRAQTSRNQLQLARYLILHDKGPEGAQHAVAAGKPADEDEADILREIIEKLVLSRQFSDAYRVWAANHEGAPRDPAKISGNILNGNFVEPIMQNDPGFGWQLPKVPGASVLIDHPGPAAGTRGLRIDYSGDASPDAPVVYQLVMLEPNTHYVLKFRAKTEKLVSGGPPLVLVQSADSESPRILGQSKPLSSQIEGAWTAQQIDFSTDGTTRVAVLSLLRLSCTESPCPVFGSLWLGGFSLARA